MSGTLIITLLLSGIGSGFIAGLLGVGGGLITVPVLFQVFTSLNFDPDLRMHMAVGTSLCLIVITAISSVWTHHKKQGIDTNVVRKWSLWIILGVMTGAVIAQNSVSKALSLLFALIAMYAALNLYRSPKVVDSSMSGVTHTIWHRIGPIFIGCISSLVGIGGGLMTVPLLSQLGYSMRTAVGTSAAVGLIIAVPAALSFMVIGFDQTQTVTGAIGYIYWPAFLLMMPTSVIAASFGARFTHIIPELYLKVCFTTFLILSTSRMLYAVFFE